jgi:small subunit ribosomal protein S15
VISTEKKTKIVKDLQRSKTDVGSPEVQIGILTERIKEQTAHMQINKHDFMARRGLLQAVGKRKRLLKYLARENGQAYLDLVEKLKIRIAKK